MSDQDWIIFYGNEFCGIAHEWFAGEYKTAIMGCFEKCEECGDIW